jgi:hypothetical protein
MYRKILHPILNTGHMLKLKSDISKFKNGYYYLQYQRNYGEGFILAKAYFENLEEDLSLKKLNKTGYEELNV